MVAMIVVVEIVEKKEVGEDEDNVDDPKHQA